MKKLIVALAVLLVLGVFVWQAVTAHGNPDPTVKGLSPAAMILSTAVLVFREGLEAILVLAAVTAGMARTGRRDYLRAVPLGGGLAFLASIATWFVVVAVISHITAPALAVQAATGLLAIVVLLVIMNWFFHKVYWTGWIGSHSNRRKRIMEAEADGAGSARTFWGLALLGFTAIYREGFEIVLFLQDLRLRAGEALVVRGTAIGLGLTLTVAALTFLAHKKLPYKKMLVATGVLLGAVLLVMVGEEAQEMQQAGWLHTTPLHVAIPDWMGLWFSVFPTLETLAAQAVAALLVIGSYLAANYLHRKRPPEPPATAHAEEPPSEPDAPHSAHDLRTPSQTPMAQTISYTRTGDLRLALRLTSISLVWMMVEGAASLALGWTSRSLLLEGFGLDSVLELVSAAVLLWRLRVEVDGQADAARVEAVERRAARLVGYTLSVLAVGIAFGALSGLAQHQTTDTRESVWGILIGLVAKVGMPILAGWKLKVAARLGSRALRADAMEAITCGYLSVVLMVGLAVTRLLPGLWWLDRVAALALIPFLLKEGREAIMGECACHAPRGEGDNNAH